ncbi:MAG: hypothetical protein RLZZ449_591 [Actinomycetota bacterium]
MDITLLGTGSPLPDPRRGGPATLVRTSGHQILVDAGRAVVMRLAGAGTLPVMLNAVLITHLHSDHLTDLNDVITTHWVMSQQPTTLTIYGPPRTNEVVQATLAALAPDISYRLAHHQDTLTWKPQVEVIEVTPGDQFSIGPVQVKVAETHHRPVEPTVASLVRCELETGRTHQIRVHLAAIGHPVVGDATYGGVRAALPFGRPALHAARLSFSHPTSHTEVEFESPLPDDMTRLLASLSEGD